MKKTALTLLATVALAAGAGAQTPLVSFDVSGVGNTNNTISPTPTVDPSVTSGLLTRVTVVASAANNSFASNTWNITNTLITGSNYIDFDVNAASGQSVTFTTLQFAINGSNTAPNQGQWAYTLDGGTTFTLATTADGGAFTNTQPAKTALSTWTFDTPVTISGATQVEFRFFEYGATSINGGTSALTGTTRIQNAVAGPDLVLNGTSTPLAGAPEPSTWAMIAGGAALMGLIVYRRNRVA